MLFTNKSTSSISLLLIVSVVLATPSSGSILQDCAKDGLATVSKVSLTDCDFDNDTQCILKKGSTPTMSVDLVPNSEIGSAIVQVGAKIGGLYVPFPLNPDDACAAYGLNCPMTKDSQQKVSISLPIKPAYPALPNLKVQFKLVTSDKKDILCVNFPAKIVDSQG